MVTIDRLKEVGLQSSRSQIKNNADESVYRYTNDMQLILLPPK